MTPTSKKECIVANAADAALQAQVRLRAKRIADLNELPGCYAMTFRPTSWSTQQKSRVATHTVPPGPDGIIDRFEVALLELAPRIRLRSKEEKIGKGKAAKTVTRTESYWIDSSIRPLVAENLAEGKRFYHDFARLMNSSASARKVSFEREGLQHMAEHLRLTDEDERRFIHTVHRAIYMALGKIYHETMGAEAAKKPANQATKNRWNKLKEQLRLGFIGAKTATQVQSAVSELLARAGRIEDLNDQEAFDMVRRILFGTDWQRTRNLSLFALASYRRPSGAEPIDDDVSNSEK
jgi:CRISPR-associated protein Cas8a1/Csx13